MFSRRVFGESFAQNGTRAMMKRQRTKKHGTKEREEKSSDRRSSAEGYGGQSTTAVVERPL
jgi:hypothetical protein